MMQIFKVINNNMVSVRNDNGQEVMLKGLSIGYKKKQGDDVDIDKIEKRFVLADDALIRHFDQLLIGVDKNVIEICIDVIATIIANSKVELCDALYVTISDHVINLVERLENNMVFDNSILWDLRRIYPDEFKLANEAIQTLNEKLSYNIKEDEANFITLHIVNAEKTNDMHQIYQQTRLINDICDIVCSDMELECNKNNYYYNRFVMHLRYLLENIELRTLVNVNSDSKVMETLEENYPNIAITIGKITTYIDVCVNHKLTKQEQLYLMIHLVQMDSK